MHSSLDIRCIEYLEHPCTEQMSALLFFFLLLFFLLCFFFLIRILDSSTVCSINTSSTLVTLTELEEISIPFLFSVSLNLLVFSKNLKHRSQRHELMFNVGSTKKHQINTYVKNIILFCNMIRSV